MTLKGILSELRKKVLTISPSHSISLVQVNDCTEIHHILTISPLHCLPYQLDPTPNHTQPR